MNWMATASDGTVYVIRDQPTARHAWMMAERLLRGHGPGRTVVRIDAVPRQDA